MKVSTEIINMYLGEDLVLNAYLNDRNILEAFNPPDPEQMDAYYSPSGYTP